MTVVLKKVKWHFPLAAFTVLWAQYTSLVIEMGLMAQSYLNVFIHLLTTLFFVWMIEQVTED